MVLICGFANISTGIAVLLINAMRDVRAVSTFFELDFDTPMDTRVLQEDSKNRRQSQMLAQATLSLAMPAMLRSGHSLIHQSFAVNSLTIHSGNLCGG